MSDIRALLLCESANPEWQSVPLIGWSHSQALRRHVSAHMVTQVRNQAACIRAGLREGVDFTSINSEVVARPMWKFAELVRGGSGRGWTTVQALTPISYYYFEWLIWRKFYQQLRAGEFDVVHRITPMSPTVPSMLAKQCAKIGVPFVIGPMNGGLPWPKSFANVRRQEREWLSAVRWAHRLLPRQHATRQYAKAILLGSRDCFRELPSSFRDKAFYVPENAIDPSRFSVPRKRTASLPIEVLFVGRLVPYKGADLVIEASQGLIRAGKLKVTIVGSGPEEQALRQLADDRQVGHAIRFVGNVPHTELQNYYAEADVFAFPSIRELGGAVVLEAMTMGAVPIVVDYGGPVEFITESSGFCLDLGTKETITAQLQATFEKILDDVPLLHAMSEAAMQQARERHTWDAKARQVVDVYEWVVHRGEKPLLVPPPWRDGGVDRSTDLPCLPVVERKHSLVND